MVCGSYKTMQNAMQFDERSQIFTGCESDFSFIGFMILNSKLGKFSFFYTYDRIVPPVHNHIWYGVAIWNKLLIIIFENFEIEK